MIINTAFRVALILSGQSNVAMWRYKCDMQIRKNNCSVDIAETLRRWYVLTPYLSSYRFSQFM